MNYLGINDLMDFDRTVAASGENREGSHFRPGDMLGQYRKLWFLEGGDANKFIILDSRSCSTK